MNVTSAIEEKLGLKIENLNAVEKETYYKMLEVVQKSQLNPDKLKEYIVSMREAVANELAKEPTFIRIFIFKVENPNLIKLQARLQNYILLENFLISPQKAQQALEEMIANIGRG